MLASTYTAITKANTQLEISDTVERAAANTDVAIEPKPKLSRPRPRTRLLASTYTAITKANTQLEISDTVERAAANTDVAIEPKPKLSRPCAPEAESVEEPLAGWNISASLSTSTPLWARARSISGRRSASSGAIVLAEAMSCGTRSVTARTATPAIRTRTMMMLAMVMAPLPGRRPSGRRAAALVSMRSMPETGTLRTNAKPRPSSTGNRMSRTVETAWSTTSRCMTAAYRQTPNAMSAAARRVCVSNIGALRTVNRMSRTVETAWSTTSRCMTAAYRQTPNAMSAAARRVCVSNIGALRTVCVIPPLIPI